MKEHLFRVWDRKKKRWLEGEALGLKMDEYGRLYDDYTRLPDDRFVACFSVDAVNAMRPAGTDNYLEYDTPH